MSEPGHVWVDGSVLPADGPHLSAYDRGFQLGDGIFETLRARGGRPVELAAHLARLGRSAHGLAIPLPADVAPRVEQAIADLLRAEGRDGPGDDVSIRITVSRGAHRARGLLPLEEGVPATIVIQAWPVPPPSPAHLADGLRLVASAIRRDPMNPLAGLKTTSRADFVFARLEALRAGADDAIFLTLEGHLSEATSANLFLLRRGSLATPSEGCAILAGTTRSWILDWARRSGLEVEEARLTVDDLLAADEAFVSSSVAGILPVTRFEGRPIGDGHPGPWGRRAREEREAWIRSAVESPA